jgi:hypothetical protein
MKNALLAIVLALSLTACQQSTESPDAPAFPSGTLVDLICLQRFERLLADGLARVRPDARV